MNKRQRKKNHKRKQRERRAGVKMFFDGIAAEVRAKNAALAGMAKHFPEVMRAASESK